MASLPINLYHMPFPGTSPEHEGGKFELIVRILLEVLNKLVDKGNTIIIIEHNIDMLKVVDYIIELGPKGGEEGGTITYQLSLIHI